MAFASADTAFASADLMQRLRICVLAAAIGALSACTAMRPDEAASVAPAASPAMEDPGPAADLVEPDQGPDTLVAFYAEEESRLTGKGLLRRETAPSDVPFTVEDLVRNFERIAFYDEYVEIAGRLINRETPTLLRRWDHPVHVGVVTGASLPEGRPGRDRAHVAEFTRRLAGLTGLDLAMDDGTDVNFLVLVLTTEERFIFATEARERYSRFEPEMIDELDEAPSRAYCFTIYFADPQDPSLYSQVIVLVPAEHPALTRLSCIHEEMAQAMGLPNDSPEARPSLFNDGLEFAFLTEHDEILLRMLYDPRLKPGMSAEEARPLLPQIARDAMDAAPRGDDPPGPRAGT